jgi:class 3 adenylate cyclase/Tfp pilus assembly protein PilF
MDGRDAAALDAARVAYAEKRWGDARSEFSSVSTSAGLAGEDCERLAWACRWERDLDTFADWLERAEATFVAEGGHPGAARMALELARHHKQMLGDIVAMAHYMRALEHLDGQEECAEHAQAHWSLSFTQLEAGQMDEARASLDEALAIARRTGHPGMEALALQGQAHLAVLEGERTEGLSLLDRATALAMRPDVSPNHAGTVYCATISICRAWCDWRRASEWTQVSTRYCERESITGYTGQCRFHQAEIDRLHGHLEKSEAEVLGACDELVATNRYVAAWAFAELVEVRVRRGDLAGAERALARALELGADGQPGRGRLELARGEPEAALHSMGRALADPGLMAREYRIFVLPIHVRAAIAVGDLMLAGESVDQLSELALRLETPGPAAAAAVARGELALATGDAASAVSELTAGVRGWCEIEAPYEAADARVLLGRVLHAEGDGQGARLEWEVARTTFAEIGADVDAAAVVKLLEQSRSGPRNTEERTFLFSDIVGSTRLAEAMGDESWEALLAWHDRTLRSIFEQYAGWEVKHAGDGFFVAFADADAAMACAAAIQEALADHRGAQGFAPSVRIGLHRGEATERDGDYYGGVVNRAARIADSGDAGEVVVSREVLAECVVDHEVLQWRTLQLKGIIDPVEVALVVGVGE